MLYAVVAASVVDPTEDVVFVSVRPQTGQAKDTATVLDVASTPEGGVWLLGVVATYATQLFTPTVVMVAEVEHDVPFQHHVPQLPVVFHNTMASPVPATLYEVVAVTVEVGHTVSPLASSVRV